MGPHGHVVARLGQPLRERGAPASRADYADRRHARDFSHHFQQGREMGQASQGFPLQALGGMWLEPSAPRTSSCTPKPGILTRRAPVRWGGYDLITPFDSWVGSFWPRPHPQTYKELPRLEQE